MSCGRSCGPCCRREADTVTEKDRCRHPDCIYRNHENPRNTGRCRYWQMTGHCRTAGLPEHLKLPSRCPRYVSDGVTPKHEDALWHVKALALYEKGLTDREIAEAIGISRDTFGEWRRRSAKLPPNPDRKGPESRFDWKKAEELYRQGLNDSEIARVLGCSTASVWRWRAKYELFPPKKQTERKETT